MHTLKLITPILISVHCIWWTLCATACGHPFHTSTAEMELNQENGKLEVSIKLDARDLERALALHSRQTVKLEAPEAAALIARYVHRNYFVFKQNLRAEVTESAPEAITGENWPDPNSLHNHQPTGSSSPKTEITVQSQVPEKDNLPLRLVGSEIESTWIWLYVEITPPAQDKLASFHLANTLLFDVNPGQINVVSWRSQGQRRSFKTSAKQPAFALAAGEKQQSTSR
ncbi:MAG: hypothetical protein KDB22_29465 [Planctomycetales bacterium]|nr:hypothetical protein [Planctomycetales bacterium]